MNTCGGVFIYKNDEDDVDEREKRENHLLFSQPVGDVYWCMCVCEVGAAWWCEYTSWLR